MTSRRALQDRIFDIEEELKHKDRLHAALLDGHDAISRERDGANTAAEILATQNQQLTNTLTTIRAYADNLTESTSSAYRKAGRRLHEILNSTEQEQEAAS